MRRLKYPETTGLLIRRTFKQLSGNHIRPLLRAYPWIKHNGYYNKTDQIITFPNRSELVFGHCEHEEDVLNYQGQEFHDIAVEEVTQFTEFQWDALKQSNRVSDTVLKPCMWATGNPGGIGHLWVKRLWIDRLFQRGEDPEDHVFIPAKVWDNVAVVESDPDYVRTLIAMKDPMLRQAYLEGNWFTFSMF